MLRARRAAFVAALPASGRAEALASLAGHVVPFAEGHGCVAGYVAVGAEIDPLPLLRALADRGVALALPVVVDRVAPLRFLRWSPGEPLVAGPFSLRQPAPDAPEVRPGLILAPLLAFDRRGGRLGQGAGHYDRAFAALPDARRIGLAWSVQEVDALPLDPWDVPLHAIVTERGPIR